MSFGSTWMPFAGDDFWESERVASMDDSAALLYQWLIWRQFKHGSLPSPDVLRRLPHRWGATWDIVWPQVAPCFEVLDDGRLENPRCREEREAALARSEKASRNGARGGRPSKAARENPDESEPKATAKRPVSESGSRSEADANPEQSSDRTGPDITEHTVCAPHARTREASPPESESEPAPPALTDTARAELVRHAALCTAPVNAALVRWEAWARGRGKLSKWTSERWAEAFAVWSTWGPERLVRAIERSIVVGSDTVLEPFAGSAAQPSKPAPDPVAARSQAERAARERDVERRWESLHTVEREMPGIDGAPVKRLVLDSKYPGHEAAERELRGLGLISGNPPVFAPARKESAA